MEITSRKKTWIAIGCLLSIIFIVFLIQIQKKDVKKQQATVVSVPSPFMYTFNTNETLSEAGSSRESGSQYWWVDSGGFLFLKSGIGSTIQGELPRDDVWRITYAKNNPEDTDDGYHPQNIFRLITRSVWKDFRQEMYFRITKDNLSQSPNRDESNGLLLFNRYKDSNNLYYAGIRVDGAVAIKKKIDGVYHLLALKQFLPGEKYNRMTNPTLLPKNTWIGLRTEVSTSASSTVSIKLYIDIGKVGNWKLAVEAVDEGNDFGQIIDEKAHAGVRTDFMDVELSDYKIENI